MPRKGRPPCNTSAPSVGGGGGGGRVSPYGGGGKRARPRTPPPDAESWTWTGLWAFGSLPDPTVAVVPPVQSKRSPRHPNGANAPRGIFYRFDGPVDPSSVTVPSEEGKGGWGGDEEEEFEGGGR